MSSKALRPISSKEYTHAYCREWTVAQKEQRPEKPKLFILFPSLEEGIRGKRVLEIGCGGGGSVKLFRQIGADITGIDMFRTPTVEGVVQGDFMTMPLAGPYDFIFAFGVFEKCALFSPAVLRNDESWHTMHENSPPPKLLERLRELLVKKGQCLFETYVERLMFTKEMAADAGFRRWHIARQVNSTKYGGLDHGDGGTYMDAQFSPENYYVLTRTK